MRILVFLAAILISLQSSAQTTQPLDDLRRLLVVTYANTPEPFQLQAPIEQFVFGKSWSSSLQASMKWSDAEIESFVHLDLQSNQSVLVTLRQRDKYDSAMALNLITQDFNEWLAKFLNTMISSQSTELNRIKNEITRKMMLLEDDQRRLTVELQRTSGRMDVSADGVRERVKAIDTALQTMTIDEEGRKARIGAIQSAIAKLDAQVKERVESDPIVQELQKLVDLRSERLQVTQKKFESGAASKDEVSKAIEELAETRARVLEQRASAGKDAGLAQIDRFNLELLDLSIKAAEDEARSKWLRDQQVNLGDIDFRIRQVNLLADQQKAYEVNIAELDKALTTNRRGNYGRVSIRDYKP